MNYVNLFRRREDEKHSHHPSALATAFHAPFATADPSWKPSGSIAHHRFGLFGPASMLFNVLKVPVIPPEFFFNEHKYT
jgi:hypothetical protein